MTGSRTAGLCLSICKASGSLGKPLRARQDRRPNESRSGWRAGGLGVRCRSASKRGNQARPSEPLSRPTAPTESNQKFLARRSRSQPKPITSFICDTSRMMSALAGLKRGACSPPEAITLSSDSDQESGLLNPPLKRPKKESSSTPAPVAPISALATDSPPKSSAFPSRAELEAERLARHQARTGGSDTLTPSVPLGPASKPVNVATLSMLQSPPTDFAPSQSGGGKSNTLATLANLSGGGEAATPRAKHQLRFWKGALKKVPNKYRYNLNLCL